MKWWIFKIVFDTLLLEVNHPKRPSDANPSNGDPATPWYQTEEHWDESHIHILANNESEAVHKAYQIMLEVMNKKS